MSKLRKVVGSVASLVFVGGLIALALNFFQLLRDQLRVWQYQPSSAYHHADRSRVALGSR